MVNSPQTRDRFWVPFPDFPGRLWLQSRVFCNQSFDLQSVGNTARRLASALLPKNQTIELSAVMQAISPFVMGGILSLGLTALSVRAQVPPPPPLEEAPPPVTFPLPDPLPPLLTPLTPEKPVIVVVPVGVGDTNAPVRPPQVDAPWPSQEVQDKIAAFRAARDAFLAKQRALAKTSRRSLTEEQRQQLLEAIKANQQEFRDRLLEIKEEFRNRQMDEVIDAAKRATEEIRDRRGLD